MNPTCILLLDLLSYLINHACLLLINAEVSVYIQMSTLDPSNWLVFLFLPWDLRVPCRCTLPCKHQIEFPSWTRHYHETICKSDKLLGSSVISYRVHWSQSICNYLTQLQEHSTPLFRPPCSNAQFIPSPGIKAMKWEPRSLGRIS